MNLEEKKEKGRDPNPSVKEEMTITFPQGSGQSTKHFIFLGTISKFAKPGSFQEALGNLFGSILLQSLVLET